MEPRSVPVRTLLFVARFASSCLTGIALAGVLHARQWDILDWQGIVASAIFLAAMIFFVMGPLRVVEAELERMERDAAEEVDS